MSSSPTIDFDSDFSRILMEKKRLRDESRLMTDNSNLLAENTLNLSGKMMTDEKKVDSDLNNSMLPIRKQNKSLCDVSDDSFLEMERRCNEDESNKSPSINETLLFDIEPPSNLWDQSSFFNLPMLNNIQSQQNTINASPAKLFGPIRPSTIIEETSSQFSAENEQTGRSSSSNSTSASISSTSTSNLQSLSPAASSLSVLDGSIPESKSSNKSTMPPELFTSTTTKAERLPEFKSNNVRKRETMIFKKKHYRFFSDENDSKTHSNLNTPRMSHIETIQNENLIDLDSPLVNKSIKKNEFNDTLEAVDYFIEEGRRRLENDKTPFCDRGNHNNTRSILETPFLSCKRTRILSEMSTIESFPIAKRGPLFDLLSPNKTDSPIVKKL